jgi:hypothetical protein
MARTLAPRFLAALDLHALNDTRIHQLTHDVAQAATTSPLALASLTMQARIAELVIADDNLTLANQVVAADRAKLRSDIAAEAVVRFAAVSALRIVAAVLAQLATSPADVQGAGLPAQPARSPRYQVPPVPASIDTKPPRTGRGKTTVSVHETGPIHYRYAAEQSFDGVTWTQLGVGRGKTRVVTGASGTQVWVRFATVRGQRQSEWCTPVLVTIP